jgi:hypothetical protein
MQILTVLLLIIGVVVLMAAAFAGISYGLGVTMHSREGVVASPGDRDPCAQCIADRDWYMTLPMWKQNALLAWWWTNRFQCAARGCR